MAKSAKKSIVEDLPVREIKDVEISSIDFAEVNREKIDVTKLAGLAETIKKHGIINDVTVAPKAGDRYECVAGERRIRAAKLAGLKVVRAKICEGLSAEVIVELRLIENIQRDDLTVWDEAAQVHELKSLRPDARVEDLALQVGRSAGWIATRLSFSKMNEPLRKLLVEQDWPIGHVPLLSRVPLEAQDDLVAEIKQMQKTRWARWTGQKPKPEVPDRSELEAWLSHRQQLLSAAKWDLDDADLVPAAGACSVCPKRSSAEQLLFPEAAKAKDDRCLDLACWRSKETALIKVGIAKLREKEIEPVFLHSGTIAPALAKELGVKPDQVENFYSYTECKKSDKGAKPAIVLSNGSDGKVHYVRTYSHSNGAAKKARPVDQDTGKPAEPSTKERLAALVLKRRCRAIEFWSKRLTDFKPDLTTVSAIAAVFGTSSHAKYIASGTGATWEKLIKIGSDKEIASLLWQEVVPVLRDRLNRNGAMETFGAKLWKEAESQANVLGQQAVFEQVYTVAVMEVKMPKILLNSGVGDPDRK